MRRIAGLLCITAMLTAAPAAKETVVRIPAWLESAEKPSLAASFDNDTVQVISVRGPSDDLMVLAVLDLAGDLAFVNPAREALKAEIARLPANAWAGVLRAQDGLRVLADPSADRGIAARAIDEASVSGRAGLLDSIETAVDLADSILSRSEVRVAVVYITDADIYNYREDYTNPVVNSSDSHDLSRRFPEALIRDKIGKLEAKLAAKQAPVFAVQVVTRSGRLNEAYQTGVDQLARATGGSAWFCRSIADIPAGVASAFESIRSHYSIAVALPRAPKREFQIRLTAGDLRVTHRTRFAAKKD